MKLPQSFRILLKYRLYTAFALVGLSIATSSVWFIADYVSNSYQYDGFHAKKDRIFRVSMEITAGGHTDHYATTGTPLGEHLMENYPGVEGYAKMKFMPSIVRHKEDAFNESGFFGTNPETLNTFSFDFISGGTQALTQPNSIILSESLAKKYFSGVDIINKSLEVNDENYVVQGVFRDWPKNSHLTINALVSLPPDGEYEAQSWFDIEQYTYVLLENGTTDKELNSHLQQLMANHLGPMIEGSGLTVNFQAQPLNEIYFSPGLVGDVAKGNQVYIHALTIAGFFVLLIAGLNFVNLTLTRSTQRSKEIFLKKVLGISRRQLVKQSAVESSLLTFLVLLFSSGLILGFEGLYHQYTGYTSLTLAGNWGFISTVALLIFAFGLLGSSYTGIYLSFSNRSIGQEGAGVGFFKKLLLGFQYSIAAVVLILTLTMDRQLDFIKNKDLGFDKNEVVIVSIPEDTNLGVPLRDHLASLAAITDASLIGGGALPGEENGKEIFEVSMEGGRQEKVYNIYRIDEHYFDLLDIEMLQGRNFDPTKASDRSGSVIINEALANSLGWEDPLGKEIWYGERMEVVGVIKNFHNKSLHNLVEPIVFVYDQNYALNLLVKAKTNAIPTIEAAWKDFYPDMPFMLTHFDEFINRMYTKEDQLMRLFQFFSFISLVLCSMGLFALFSLHVKQKTKELSIRKILGANFQNLTKNIAKKYSTVVLLAIAFAIPAAWLAIRSWLAEFSYAMEVGVGSYLLSTAIIVVASIAVIALQLVKVVQLNPVETLKEE